MNFRKERFSAREARQIDMVDYLSKLGYEPVKTRNADYWYLSPLREEKTASFKINRKLNRWYDHGLGKGGNIIDFAILFLNCTVGEFLQQINKNFSFHKPDIVNANQQNKKPQSKIIILKEGPLFSYSLIHYLQQRRIPLKLADQYCKEITYELNGREYFGIGFQNDAGGYEIRNPYFKCSSSPKDITTINKAAKEAFVFEGFIDFLSFLSIYKNLLAEQVDFVILNSVSFFERARVFYGTT